jgi:H-type small acid-soluble spore protein
MGAFIGKTNSKRIRVVIELDSNRAKQILNGKENIDVIYQGTPVWIEGVSDNNIAEVTSLAGSKDRFEVPVSRLEERKQ